LIKVAKMPPFLSAAPAAGWRRKFHYTTTRKFCQ